MPIEIRELIIRTHIVEDGIRPMQQYAEKQKLNEKEIIERCVEKVIKKLSKKTDR